MKNISLFKKLILSFFCLFSFSVYAADIVVNGSGLSGTYTTISAGINAASPGDRVLVSNQSFPYQEDTIFINKSVTILPYNDVSHIHFEGHFMITLDSISELNLIGFNSNSSNVRAVFNDTSRNSLTTINIIDCDFDQVYLSFPKTSVYTSFSSINAISLAHGDVIGCDIQNLVFGDFDENNNFGYNGSPFGEFGFISTNYNQIGQNYFPNECELDNSIIPFGNVDTYSDTCNFIGNKFVRINFISKDFAVNFRNNKTLNYGFLNYGYFTIISLCSSSKGTNNIINNTLDVRLCLDLYKCSSNGFVNFRDISLRFLNNDNFNNPDIRPPSYNNASSIYNYSNINNLINNSITSYNKSSYMGCSPNCSSLPNIGDSIFQQGPSNYNNDNPNPSSEFLNLDLSLNIVGINGGSYAWENIIGGNSEPGFGSIQNSFTNSKARITYLNLPTQIFDPANIKIKAKAVHGN